MHGSHVSSSSLARMYSWQLCVPPQRCMPGQCVLLAFVPAVRAVLLAEAAVPAVLCLQVAFVGLVLNARLQPAGAPDVSGMAQAECQCAWHAGASTLPQPLQPARAAGLETGWAVLPWHVLLGIPAALLLGGVDLSGLRLHMTRMQGVLDDLLPK